MKNYADTGWSYSSFHTLPHQIIFTVIEEHANRLCVGPSKKLFVQTAEKRNKSIDFKINNKC